MSRVIENRTMHLMRCQQCGLAFFSHQKRRRFCSLQCTGRANGDAIRRPIEPVTCNGCGCEFIPRVRARKRQNNDYCSRECAYKNRYGKPKSESTPIKWNRCEMCQKVFIRRRAGLLCSDVCREEQRWLLRHSSEKCTELQLRLVSRRTRECAECRTVFTVQFEDKRTGFCSKRCCVKHNQRRQNMRGLSSHKHRARHYGCEYAPVEAIDVLERDGWICQLCGKPIDRSAKFPAPWSKSIDHIIPMSKRGPHTMDNLQAAHLKCNMHKAAKVNKGDGSSIMLHVKTVTPKNRQRGGVSESFSA